MNEDNRIDIMSEPVFVPLPLNQSLEVPRKKRVDKAFGWVIGTVSVGLAFWFFTNKSFRDFTGLGMFMTICLYAVFCTFLGSFFLIKFVFKTDKKIMER